MRRLCSGKTLAFQAKDAGSIPARRSRPLKITPPRWPATHYAPRRFHKGYVIARKSLFCSRHGCSAIISRLALPELNLIVADDTCLTVHGGNDVAKNQHFGC